MPSPKNQGIHIEINPYSILAASTAGGDLPLQVTELREFPASTDAEKIGDELAKWYDIKKGARAYVKGHCAGYPSSRFIRRHTLDQPAKAKEPAFLADLLNNQFRIDPEKNTIAIINATDGSLFDTTKNLQNQKELLLCGALVDEWKELQGRLLGWNIFPESIQLGQLAVVAGLMDYARWANLTMPTMLLEITPESSNLFIFSGNQLDIARPIPHGLNGMFPMVQQELGLKDEESARKLFYSNTFDFTEMGSTLLRKMLKELQASTGFYEVQTGQTIGQLFISLLPKNLNWIGQVLSRSLGVKVLNPDYTNWLKQRQITLADSIQPETLDARWFGLFCLMGQFSPLSKDAEKKA